MPKLITEQIADIRNALQIIQGNAEYLKNRPYINEAQRIVSQVKRIDKLLPKVSFEGAEK